MQRASISIIIPLIAAFAFATAVQAQVSEEPRSISVQVSANQIVWQPSAGGNRLSVTVTGPGEYAFTHVYKKNELAIFQAIDPDGNPLPDGTYSYEIEELSDNPGKRPETDKQGLPEKSKGKGPLFLRESGSFSVLNGSIVDPNQQEGSEGTKGNSTGLTTNAAAPDLGLMDQVINDDLIVLSSLCVGFDCVNNESFGFDTIRMKENNTRIHFDDTSTAAGFPSTDWELEANQSASGGRNSFTLIDRTQGRRIFSVEGGAPSNSLYVEDSGNVGFGTSAPVVEMHALDGDTPALRLHQDGSSGFSPQVWDVAGNETNFFIRDVTNGSTLPFRIFPGAPSSSILIHEDGNVGIGTSSPTERLHVTGTDNPRLLISDTSDNANDKPGLVLRSPASASSGDWVFEVDNAGNFQIDFSPSAGPELVISDNPTGNGTVTVNGNLVVNGICTGCDAVFQDGFGLESIEEHASFMWANSYLPAVGPTSEGETSIDVFQKTTGILQELEKAHIYIAQLHEEKSQLKMAQNEMLIEQNRMADELETLRKLEAENEELREQLLQISLRLNSLETSASTHTRKIE